MDLSGIGLGSGITLFIFAAMVVQFLTERARDLLPVKATEWIDSSEYFNPSFIAMAFALLLCFILRIDLFEMLGVESASITADYIISALIISGGSTAVNDFLKSLTALKSKDLGK